MATGASAATLIGSSSGEFTSEDGFNVSASGNQLTWPGASLVNPQSTLTIDNFGFNAPVPLGNSEQKVGQLTWENASSFPTFSPSFDADATLTLDYDSPSDIAGTEGVTFSVTNTSGGNPDGIATLVLDGLFDFGLGVPLDLGQGVTVTSYFAKIDGAFGTFSNGSWSNEEGETSTLGIYANISAVPLPAAGWLMIAGIGGLAALRRRRKAA